MLITVIIPFYNSEKYIKKCLTSVLNQTYKDLEIILVNDGSKDNSRNICKEMMKNDSRIKLLDKENGGVSSARNIGIKKATGDFITFVDSDDELEIDLYEKMVKSINEEVDIICCGLKRCDSNGNLLYILDMSYGKQDFTPFEAMKACLQGKEIGFNVYTKLFRKKLFYENGEIKFPEGRLMEEAAVLPYLFKKSRMIRHCGYTGYKYYIRENSYTTKTLSEECFYVYETINNYKKNLYKLFPGIEKYIDKWRFINCINLYRTALIDKKSIKKDVYKRVKEEFNKIWLKALFSNSLSFREKMILLETKSRVVVLRKRGEKNAKK